MKNWIIYLFVLLVSALLAGCGGESAYAPDLTSTGTGFSLSISAGQTISPGDTASFTISEGALAKPSREANPIALTVLSGVPSGATASISPSSINRGGSGTLSVVTTNAIVPGTYNIVVQGASGGIKHTVTAVLTVSSAADFIFSGNPSPLIVDADSTTTLDLETAFPEERRTGETVTFTILSTLPTGISTAFIGGNAGTIGTPKQLRVSAEFDISTQDFDLSIRASNGMFTHDIVVPVHVNGDAGG